jgi:flagellar motor component MotA
MQKSIRKKRDEFLLGIEGQFQESEENKTLFVCYDYVKIVTETTMDSFIENLTQNEMDLVERNTKTWFLPIESIRTFAVFLSNNQITISH